MSPRGHPIITSTACQLLLLECLVSPEGEVAGAGLDGSAPCGAASLPHAQRPRCCLSPVWGRGRGGDSSGGSGAQPGCPQDVLEWRTARTFLYWRLRRLLLEGQVKQEVLRASGDLGQEHVQSMLRRWFVETEGAVKVGLGQGRAGVPGACPAGSRLSSLSPPGLPVGQQPGRGPVAGAALAGGGGAALRHPREHQVPAARLRPQDHPRVSVPSPPGLFSSCPAPGRPNPHCLW